MHLPVLLALLLIDWSLIRVVVWIVEAVKIESGMYTVPFATEVAFAIGGLVVLVGTPVCGWRLLSRVDEPSGTIPRAKVIR